MNEIKNQPEALRLTDWLEANSAGIYRPAADAASELRRLHAENQDLRTRHYCNTAEIEALQSRVQELGEMARENRSRRVIELERRIAELESEAEQNTKIIGASAETELALRARVEEQARELAAIGAVGVEPLRKRAATVSDEQIKAVFLTNGFKIKEGMTDLKPYVYQAARALLATGGQAKADARDAERWIGIGKAIQRACADLPEETEIIVSLEKGAGTVTLIDQDGNEHENFSTDYGFAGVMNEAIDTAIAAQAKKVE